MDVRMRPGRPADLPGIMRLLASAFDGAAPEMFRAQTLADSTFRWRHARVAVGRDGDVRGYVRIFARTMMVAGVPVAAGGIGSVATVAAARRRGVASALMVDAITQMRREGMSVSFLFTGIPAFYERFGYRIVREPYVAVARGAVVGDGTGGGTRVRRAEQGDVPAMLRMYRARVAGRTGAVLRTARTWVDAGAWLDDETLVAMSSAGGVLAYVRSRCRPYGHQVLEAEARPGAEAALRTLVERVAAGACDCARMVALVPEGHPLLALLRSYAGAAVTTDVEHPMMTLALTPKGDFGGEAPYFWNSDRI